MLAALLLPSPLLAAGGPHLVDDAGTVTPGTCELEAFGDYAGSQTWLAVVSPTCALPGWKGFEIGVIAAAEGPTGQVIPGIAAKAYLGAVGRVSFGAEISVGFDPEGNQSQYIETNLAADVETVDWLELHFNAGVDFQPGRIGIPTYGAAIMVEPVADWQLVAEIAGRSGFGNRRQYGLRHTVGNLVFDLMYAGNIDGAGANGVTAGLIWTFGLR